MLQVLTFLLYMQLLTITVSASTHFLAVCAGFNYHTVPAGKCCHIAFAAAHFLKWYEGAHLTICRYSLTGSQCIHVLSLTVYGVIDCRTVPASTHFFTVCGGINCHTVFAAAHFLTAYEGGHCTRVSAGTQWLTVSTCTHCFQCLQVLPVSASTCTFSQ